MSVDLEHLRAAPPSGLAGFDTFGKDRRAERRFLIALFLVLAAIYCVFAFNTYADARGLHDGLGVLIGRDFVVYWTASVLTLKGQVASLFDLGQFTGLQRELVGATVDGYPWLYPPQALLYILPLGLLPYLWSYALWSVATFALYLVAVQGRRWTTVEPGVSGLCRRPVQRLDPRLSFRPSAGCPLLTHSGHKNGMSALPWNRASSTRESGQPFHKCPVKA